MSLYPVIQERKIEKQFESAFKHLTTGELQDKEEPKSMCERIAALLGKTKEIKPQENIFDLKLTAKDEEPVRQLFNTLLYSNRTALADGLDGVDEVGKDDQIALGAYTFLVSKDSMLSPGIWSDHGVFNEMLQVFKARYFYILYQALSSMKITDVTVKWDKFEQMFVKHVGNKGDEYVIIDNDSSMDVMMTMDKPKNGAKWSFHRYYKGAFYYHAGRGSTLYLQDEPLVEAFDKTILIARFKDLPTPVAVSSDSLPMVNFEDESDREKGWATVRITVDPCCVAKYSKNAEILRVRVKWR